MSRVAELLRSRRVPQVAVLALMSVGFAGCSADMQTRLSETLLQSLCLAARSHRFGARARRRTPRAAAIFPAAGVLRAAIPVPGLAAARRRCAARLSGQFGRACREEGAGFRPMRRRPIRRSRPPPRCRRARSRPRARLRRTAPRSSSAPATRSTVWRSATTFPPPRSCRPMATRARACCRPASS